MAASTNPSRNDGHEGPWATTTASHTGVSSNRAIVMALAGVSRAEGPKEVVRGSDTSARTLFGDGDRFLRRIADIRARFPEAAFRSNFIVGYPGETEDDHDQLLRFVEEGQLDWVGFFSYSKEDGTYAADLDGAVDEGLVKERLVELEELQESITAAKRRALVGATIEVLVDSAGVGRSHRETPEIDGIVEVPEGLAVGDFHRVTVTGAFGPDLVAAAE